MRGVGTHPGRGVLHDVVLELLHEHLVVEDDDGVVVRAPELRPLRDQHVLEGLRSYDHKVMAAPNLARCCASACPTHRLKGMISCRFDFSLCFGLLHDVCIQVLRLLNWKNLKLNLNMSQGEYLRPSRTNPHPPLTSWLVLGNVL